MKDYMIFSIPLEEVESMITKSVERALQSKSSTEVGDTKYISISTACSILSVTPPTVYEYIERGKLKKYKIDSTTRLLKSEVLSIVIPE